MVHITPITLWGRGHQQNHPFRFRSGFFFFFIRRSLLLSSLSSKALSAVFCNLNALSKNSASKNGVSCMHVGEVERWKDLWKETEAQSLWTLPAEAHLWPRPSLSLFTFLCLYLTPAAHFLSLCCCVIALTSRHMGSGLLPTQCYIFVKGRPDVPTVKTLCQTRGSRRNSLK